MSIDLQTFCGGPYGLPFSQGDHTYATDGNLVVRVPKRSEVPLNVEIPMWSMAKAFVLADVASYQPLKPDGGLVGEARFNQAYLDKIAALPKLEVAHAGQHQPMPFRFKGGSGLLMPLKTPIKKAA